MISTQQQELEELKEVLRVSKQDEQIVVSNLQQRIKQLESQNAHDYQQYELQLQSSQKDTAKQIAEITAELTKKLEKKENELEEAQDRIAGLTEHNTQLSEKVNELES